MSDLSPFELPGPEREHGFGRGPGPRFRPRFDPRTGLPLHRRGPGRGRGKVEISFQLLKKEAINEL